MKRFWVCIAVAAAFEARAQQRLTVRPSIDMMEIADSNLNYSAVDPVSDRIRRVTPALSLELNSSRWLLAGAASFDGEQFMTHRDFNDPRARERAGMSLQYRATPRFVIALAGSYFGTNTLNDLNTDTALASARVRGKRFTATPSLKLQLSPTRSLSASANAVRTNIVNGTGMRSEEGSLGYEQRLTPRSRLTVDYAHSRINFTGDAPQLVNTDTLIVGWSRELGMYDAFSIQAGPRLTNGTRLLDANISLTHRWSRSSIALSLTQDQTTVIGTAGIVDSRSAQAKYSFTPARNLTFFTAPAFYRSSRGAFTGTVFRVAAGASYDITSFLKAELTYGRDAQHGAIDPLFADATFSRSVTSFGLSTHWR